MRMFMDFTETREEVKRDLSEMGHTVNPKSYQNKIVEGNSDFGTKELRNYVYTILNPDLDEIFPYTDEKWVIDEAAERFSGQRFNPGVAWLHRKELWSEFMNEEGQQDYTYPERFNPRILGQGDSGHYHYSLNQLVAIAQELRDNPDSRQCYLSIWEPGDIENIGGKKRVPCTLGYLFQVREGELHITYFQRSCDFIEHYSNDVYLAVATAKDLANRIKSYGGPEYPVGSFTHFVGSMHIYNKDIKGVF